MKEKETNKQKKERNKETKKEKETNKRKKERKKE